MCARPQRGPLRIRNARRSIRLTRGGHNLDALRFTQADDGHPDRLFVVHALQVHRADPPPAALPLARTR